MKAFTNRKKKGKRSFLYSILLVCLVILVPTNCTDEPLEPPMGDEDWSFIVFGDLRQGFSIYDILVSSMVKIDPTPRLALCGGDIMESPNNEIEWIAFWEHSKPLTDIMPMHIARGNHEGNEPHHEAIFRSQMMFKSASLYYAFTVENSRFIICDTEIPGANGGIVGDQLEWLKDELDFAEGDDDISHIFINMHRPLFPQGSHYGEDMINAHELHDIFVDSDKLKAIFVSHDHIFNRLQRDGVEYITTGGAGAYLHRNRGGDYHHYLKVSITKETNRVNLKSIGLFNEVVEDFDL